MTTRWKHPRWVTSMLVVCYAVVLVALLIADRSQFTRADAILASGLLLTGVVLLLIDSGPPSSLVAALTTLLAIPASSLVLTAGYVADGIATYVGVFDVVGEHLFFVDGFLVGVHGADTRCVCQDKY